MLIVYTNGIEAIVCTSETEEETIRLFFTEGGRDMEEYDKMDTGKECAFLISGQVSIR